MPHSTTTPPSRPPKMHFVLSRVAEEDFDELLEVQFRAFQKVGLHEALFGPNTKENRDRVKKQFVQDMHSDASDYWMKLVDTTTNRIVSASQWKIYPSWAPLKSHDKFQATWFEGEDRKMAEYLCEDFMTRRSKHMFGHAHVCMS